MKDEFIFVSNHSQEEGCDFWEGLNIGFSVAVLITATLMYSIYF